MKNKKAFQMAIKACLHSLAYSLIKQKNYSINIHNQKWAQKAKYTFL